MKPYVLYIVKKEKDKIMSGKAPCLTYTTHFTIILYVTTATLSVRRGRLILSTFSYEPFFTACIIVVLIMDDKALV